MAPIRKPLKKPIFPFSKFGKRKPSSSPPSPPPPVNPFKNLPDVTSVVDASNKFAEKCSKLVDISSPFNAVYSPFCLWNMIGMVKLGARGKTQEETENTFHFHEDNLFSSAGVNKILTSLNAFLKTAKDLRFVEVTRLYITAGFEITPEFTLDLSDFYNESKLHQLDFSHPTTATEAINKNFEDATESHITSVVTPNYITPYTRLLPINAVYFRGDFIDKFERKNIYKGHFFARCIKDVQVQMMRRTGTYSYTILKALEAHAVSLPYQGDRFHFVVVLPKNPDPLALPKLKSSITTAHVLNMLQNKVSLDLILPKFRIESTNHFIQHIQKLGTKTMFDPTQADFSGITGYPSDDLYVSDVIQKVIFECWEGEQDPPAPPPIVDPMSKKSKKNSIGKIKRLIGGGGKLLQNRNKGHSRRKHKLSFHADHPFLFFVVDKMTSVILLSGVCSNPLRG